MGAAESRWIRKVLVAAVWVAGAVFLAIAVAAVAFFVVLKFEARSTQVAVPDLSGATREDAERRARGEALDVEVVQERHDAQVPSGRILQQDPPAGSSVRRGRKIRVILSLGGEVLDMPDLVGKADRQMTMELQRDGLAAGDEALVPSRLAPAGTVLAQVPPPRSPAIAGMRVHRLVSSGSAPARFVMPDLTGRPLGRVESWISDSGFRKGAVRRVEAAGRPSGTVVGQLPMGGYPVSARDAVDLTVAR
jgi:serine/threonine-protein kinase